MKSIKSYRNHFFFSVFHILMSVLYVEFDVVELLPLLNYHVCDVLHHIIDCHDIPLDL